MLLGIKENGKLNVLIVVLTILSNLRAKAPPF